MSQKRDLGPPVCLNGQFIALEICGLMTKLTRREAIRLAALGAAAPIGTGVAGAERAVESTGKTASAQRNAGVFTELPFGSVRPAGWLLQQLQKQADGITGHLEKLYAPFNGTAWAEDQNDPATEWVPWEVRG
jgi:hypothetical protein